MEEVQQAHAMSHPAANAQAELAARTQMWEGEELKLRQEIVGLNANLAFARQLLQSLVVQSINLRGEIAELTKRVREMEAPCE